MTNFLAFMEKCMSNNLTLNLEKIQFKQSQVSFCGHCWSKQGISLDSKKIEALNNMEFPLDKETMRSFPGMINYPNRYSALSAHLAAPLSALTHQAIDYKPGKVHFENFNPGGESHMLCFQSLDNDWTELSEFGERHLEQFGEWKSSTTSCMESDSHWKLTRSHL